MKIDSPGIINNRTAEQNIAAIKGWADNLASQLTYQLTQMETEIEDLKKEIGNLKEAQDGV